MSIEHHEDAQEIEVEPGEQGFELHITDTSGTVHVFNIHGVAVDLLASVERVIAPWHREGMSIARAFRCVPDESAGMAERVVAVREDGSYRVEPDDEPYDFNDPEHPRYHSIHADIWDMREGK